MAWGHVEGRAKVLTRAAREDILSLLWLLAARQATEGNAMHKSSRKPQYKVTSWLLDNA